MSQSQVLARKWRPKNFSELTGQDHVVRALTNALQQNRLHHAYLFTGTRGIGKTTVARILAKALNCETGITASPCGTCTACSQIDQGHFIDLIELDAASNTQVDHMRDLLENALYAPTEARFKIYIIDEVHMLSKSAFNAMLKTLEEPPAHVKFVLATTDPQKIPVTVLSRCLQFNLKQIPIALITEHLKNILAQENIPTDDTALTNIAKAAQGSMRDALSILDQAIAFGEGKVAEDTVRSMLGTIDQYYLHDLLEALALQNGARMLAIADEIDAQGLSFDSVLHDFSALLHHIALAQTVPQAIHKEIPAYPQILSFAKTFAAEDIQLLYQIALHGRRDLSLAPDEYAGFTMTLIRMLAFMPDNQTTSSAKQIITAAPEISDVENTFNPPAQTGKSAASFSQSDSYQTAPTAPKTPVVAPDLNWHDLVKQLKLVGMAKMLAQHSEAKLLTAKNVELFVPELHRHLLDKKYQNAIQNALDAHFGRPVALNFSVGSITGMTPVALQQLENEQKQAEAIAAIEKDPIVQDLVDSFDAKIIESSIKPIQN
ncbi:MAG: DNA polymerase III subunit gamma/tau [Burkholderiales bacterium]|uniref:DNA polymerase III subunit gamma/tau n=1 Tax=Nitrosomonas sp. TaxID=42353 RepID=UPI001DFA041E|nr:DNA polymerase III subunit gamma/tau [Nitrosomonas sp.]MCB1950019.1 DNA polymerase III subunit gamma/tau [Nitrosomonas sp.]MCP5242227.1 DNA polymerase III subunit gamma/tau [Burkholderiales bacterium]